jgi:hypothetical protein
MRSEQGGSQRERVPAYFESAIGSFDRCRYADTSAARKKLKP